MRPSRTLLPLLLLSLAAAAFAGGLNLGSVRGLLKKPGHGGSDPVAWLQKVDDTLEQVTEATRRLDEGRDALFSLGATAEEKALLQEMQARADSAGTDAEREEAVAALRSYQDETVRKAREEGRYAKKELDERQRKNLGRLLGNLGLAVLNERAAIAGSQLLIDEADDVLKGARQPRNALRLGKNAKRVVAAPGKLSSTIAAVPRQLEALGNLLAAAQELKRDDDGGAVDETPPAEPTTYETLEDF